MSNHKRGSDFANAALVVTIEPHDFFLNRPGDLDHHGPLAGIELQRALEARAYTLGGGGYVAPAQRLTDFVAGRASTTLPAHELGPVSHVPGESSGLVASDLRRLLPERLHTPLARGVLRFWNQKMKGYLGEDAILIGVETTTSRPCASLARRGDAGRARLPPASPHGRRRSARRAGSCRARSTGVRVAEAVLATLHP